MLPSDTIDQLRRITAQLEQHVPSSSSSSSSSDATTAALAEEVAKLRHDLSKLHKSHVRLRQKHEELKAQVDASRNVAAVPVVSPASESNKRLRQLLCGGGRVGGGGGENAFKAVAAAAAPLPPSSSTLSQFAQLHHHLAQDDDDDNEDDEEVARPEFPLYSVDDQVELDSRIHSPSGHNATIKEVCPERQQYRVVFPLGGRPKWVRQESIVNKGW